MSTFLYYLNVIADSPQNTWEFYNLIANIHSLVDCKKSSCKLFHLLMLTCQIVIDEKNTFQDVKNKLTLLFTSQKFKCTFTSLFVWFNNQVKAVVIIRHLKARNGTIKKKYEAIQFFC